jgi:hypothetical protein
MRKIVLAGAAVFLAGGSAVLIVASTGAASTGCGRPPVTLVAARGGSDHYRHERSASALGQPWPGVRGVRP